MGNPFPGGQCAPDVCSPEVQCAEPSICIGGRCKRRCEGVVCGVGAMCDPQTNKCVCNPYFVGNPDFLCMPRKYLMNNLVLRILKVYRVIALFGYLSISIISTKFDSQTK